MSKKYSIIFIFAMLVFACSKGLNEQQYIDFPKPAFFPNPVYDFENNQLTNEGFQLGLKLFYDPMLSADNTISCASCHIQTSGFTHHGHEVSHGIYNRFGTRNAPAIANLAWSPTFMHDGGIFDLDLQPIAPITNPVEMDESVENVLIKIRNTPAYIPLFKKAFNDDTISTAHFLKALSQFMLMCVSDHAKYDSVKRGESSFTAQEQKGYDIFLQHCNSCHTEPLFTDYSFKNNGVPINFRYHDKGRSLVTLNPADDYKFKVPSLRNLAFSPPFMHDGSINNLDEVFNHYVYLMEETPNIDPVFFRPGKNPGIDLSKDEQADLKVFLLTLNDYRFVTDKKFALP